MGYVNVHSPYIYRSEGNIQATLGVRIGLQTVNLTLSGNCVFLLFVINIMLPLGAIACVYIQSDVISQLIWASTLH